MGKIDNLSKLLANKSLQSLLESKAIKLRLEEINTIMKLLVQSNVPFTVSFSEGTHSSSPFFTLSITLTPSTSISTTIELGSGAMDVI